MNYYYPYTISPATSSSGLSNIFGRGGINFSTILNGAQRTLGLVNQAIPIIKEAAPMMRNAKTMFKVMNEFKKIDAPSSSNTNNNVNSNASKELNEKNSYNTSYNGPTFFA